MQDLLIKLGAFRNEGDYCEYRFAAGAFGDYFIAFDKDFQNEVFEKYLETYGISRQDVINMFEDAEAADSFDDENDRCFVDDMEALGVVIKDGEIVLEDDIHVVASVTRDLIKELGWECDFEGDSWGLETRSVYFIK